MDNLTKKIILQNNDENQLLENLKSYASHIAPAQIMKMIKHQMTTGSKSLSDEISKIMDMISELKSKHREEGRNTKMRVAESDIKIQSLADERKNGDGD